MLYRGRYIKLVNGVCKPTTITIDFIRNIGSIHPFLLLISPAYGVLSQPSRHVASHIQPHPAAAWVRCDDLRFVTLGFYHDQMFRAVFKALEAPCQLFKGPTDL
jgi:hypothetical protein